MKVCKWYFLSKCEKLTLIFDQRFLGNWRCVCICNQKYFKENFALVQFTIFLDGTQISKCKDVESEVNRGSFKYFWMELSPNVEKVVVEVKDIKG